MGIDVGDEIKTKVQNELNRVNTFTQEVKSSSFISNFLSQFKIPIILITIGLISIICLVYAFNSFGKNYVVGIIQDLVKQESALIDKNYKDQMKIKDDQIKEIQNKLSVSEQLTDDLKKRVGNVENKIKNRKPPVTSTELRDRFNSIGYKPTN